MRFIIYKNSVLATICSMFGAACIAMGVLELVSGEIGILPGIGVIAAGLGLSWLAMVISDRKEQKKNAKQQTAAQTANRTAAAPAYPPAQPEGGAAASAGKFPGALCVISGIFFLLALACQAIYCVKRVEYFASQNIVDQLYVIDYVQFAGLLMLGIGAFLTARKKAVSVLTALGFLCMTVVNAQTAGRLMLNETNGRWIGLANLPRLIFGNQDVLFSVLTALGFLLMAILTMLMRRRNKQPGGLIRWLWIPAMLLVMNVELSMALSGQMPHVVLALRQLKELSTNFHMWMSLGELCWLIASMLTTIARICACRKPTAETAAPASESAAAGILCPHCHQQNAEGSVFCRHCGQRMMQSQPVGQAEPEPVQKPQPSPDVNAQAATKNIQKEMEAYKDLLNCGILTQEEYDQKIRDLTRG